jgi:hypothetical protein
MKWAGRKPGEFGSAMLLQIFRQFPDLLCWGIGEETN